MLYFGESCVKAVFSFFVGSQMRAFLRAFVMYGSRWRRARAGFLRANPLCVFCAKQGRTVAATVVDHVAPHRGDAGLFWNADNWQALCKGCHDSVKQRVELGQSVPVFGADGFPVDGV